MKQNRFTARLATLTKAIVSGPLYIVKEWLSWMGEALKYYQNRSFRCYDLELIRHTGIRPPTWVYLNDYHHREPYGETPLICYEWLLNTIPNGHQLSWIEPGCGRGRGVFWLAAHLNSTQRVDHQATGVDLNPEFIHTSRAIKLHHNIKTCHFILSDFCKIDYQPYDVVFLYASCTCDEKLQDLAIKLLRLTPGSWVATISFPIQAYAIEGTFTLYSEKEINMIWGNTRVYLSQRTDALPF